MENLVSILKKFLKSQHDNVFLMKGDWGIGKTFFWEKNAEDFKSVNKDYSYYSKVSLYGKNEPIEIYRDIVFNTEVINEGYRAKSWFGKLTDYSSKIPYVQDKIGNILIEHSISKITNSIIVLDDFERISSDGFDAIFGIVNDLKEKNNKVIVISNIQGAYEELINHIEKNIDIEFLYDPEIDSIIESIFDEDIFEVFVPTIKTIANEIDLRNMRAIMKLERNVIFLLDRTSEITVKELLSDLTLYTLCRFSQTSKIPSYEYLLKTNRYSIFSDKEKGEKEKEAFRLANKHLNIHNEEIKNSLLKLIDYGYLDKKETDFVKKHIENNVENREKYKLFDKAWDYYHNSFENDSEKFINLMYTGCKENLHQITPKNFATSKNFLTELGAEDKAIELTNEFFEVNKERFEEVLVGESYRLPPSYEVKDKKINERFNLIRNEGSKTRSIKEIAEKVTYSNGWNPSDVDELASHSVDDYEKFIRNTESEDLSAYINRLIKFGNYQSASDEQKEIKSKTLKALERICQDGGLNKLRIENKFGVEC